jgi:hypothetical protein
MSSKSGGIGLIPLLVMGWAFYNFFIDDDDKKEVKETAVEVVEHVKQDEYVQKLKDEIEEKINGAKEKFLKKDEPAEEKLAEEETKKAEKEDTKEEVVKPEEETKEETEGRSL